MMALKKIDQYKKSFNDSRFKKKTMPKILSVLFAVIFWLYVMDQVNPEMVRTIPNLQIEILNQEAVTSGGYVIMSEDAPTVNITIKGRRKAVMMVKPTDIILSADVKDFHKGVNYFPINKKIFIDNVSVDSISVNRIQMSIDRLVEVSKPVTLKTTGQLPAGESLGDTKFTPEKVTIKGPESLVNQVVNVVANVDLANLNNQMASSIALEAQDANGKPVKGVTMSHSSVMASFGVLLENNTKIDVNLRGTLPAGYKVTGIEVLPDTLALKGASDQVTKLASIKTKTIDISGMTASQDINIGLIAPEGVSLQGLPETVRVKLTIEKIGEKMLTFKASDVKWFNIPDGLTVDLADPNRSITVKVNAVNSVLEQLGSADIQLEVDAGELKEGVHKLKIEAVSSLMTESLTVIPNTIDVSGVKQ